MRRAIFLLVMSMMIALPRPAAGADVVVALVVAGAEGRGGANGIAEAARRAAAGAALSGRLDPAEARRAEVRLEVFEDPCTREASAALARRIAASGAIAVVSRGCTEGLAEVAPIYAGAGKPLIVTGGNGGRAVPGVLFLPAVGETQGQFLGRQAAALASGAEAKVAVVSDRTRWALANVREASAILQAAGKGPARTETFAGGDKDFAGLAGRLAAAGVTHVVLAAFGSEAGLFVADLVKVLPGVTIVGTETLAGPEFARAAGAAVARVQVAVRPDAEAAKAESATARVLIEGLERDRIKISRTALATMATVEAISGAARQVQRNGEEVTAQSLSAALRSGQPAFQTVLGSVTFDRNGQASVAAWRLHRWVDGRLRAVQP